VLLGQLSNFNGTGANMTYINLNKTSLFLNATSPDICAGCADYHTPTLCEKWATESTKFNGDQLAMMTAVVTGVFTALVGNSSTKVFFDGTVPCGSRDFVDNTIIQGVLVTELVAFFGSAGVLGCTDGGYPQYTGNPDMGQVHEYMPITEFIYDSFVNTLVEVVQGALTGDVPSLTADLTAVGSLLYSPGVYGLICNQADCTKNGAASSGIFIGKTCSAPATAGTSTATSGAAGGTSTTGAAGTTGAATGGTTGGTTGTAAGTTGTTAAATGTTTATTTGASNNNNNPPPASAATVAFSAIVALIAVALAL